MPAAPLTENVELAIRVALRDSWSERTQPTFDLANPSYNQCAQTAIVVFERFGGEILRTQVRTTDGEVIEHFYNCIGGRRYDFTAEQFEVLDYCEAIEYQDNPVDVTAAQATLQAFQLSAMRSAFAHAIQRHLPSNKFLERAREE